MPTRMRMRSSIPPTNGEQLHDRTRPETTRPDPLEHRRPVARGDERGRLPRLHALVPVPAVPLGQLRGGRAEGAGDGLPVLRPRRHRRSQGTTGAAGPLVRSQPRRHRRVREADAPQGALRDPARAPLDQHRRAGPHAGRGVAHYPPGGLQVRRDRIVRERVRKGCSRRSTSARTSWAGPTPTATPNSARSSASSPAAWRYFRRTSIRWETHTST